MKNWKKKNIPVYKKKKSLGRTDLVNIASKL